MAMDAPYIKLYQGRKKILSPAYTREYCIYFGSIATGPICPIRQDSSAVKDGASPVSSIAFSMIFPRSDKTSSELLNALSLSSPTTTIKIPYFKTPR
jgi:hypothetical protein